MRRILLAIAISGLLAAPAAALDLVVIKHEGREVSLAGKVQVKAEDGGLLLMATDGVLWAIPPDDLIKHTSSSEPFDPLSGAALIRSLKAQLPPGFEVHTTAHYVICYNTSRAYAQWCGALYERLYFAFTNFWARKGFELHEPEMPLVALVFADKRSYQAYSRSELGDAAGAIVGYYSLRTNRVTMYDLTGVETLRQANSQRGSLSGINQMLSQPAAEPMVATIIHEATHQIAFNCGLQQRYADIPLWVSEGLAVYFETPDLRSSKGWRGIGEVNRPRLGTFRKNLPGNTPESLVNLIADDNRLREVRTAPDAYAEAWALNYFLIRQRPNEYVSYLKMLSEKPPLVWDDRPARLAEFREHFGESIEQLHSDFVRQMQTVK